MLTTALIALPFAGALLVAILPLTKTATAAVSLLVALLEVALWITALLRFDFNGAGLQLETSHDWVESLGISYSVGFFSFSFWLAGATVVVSAAAIGYALWVGRERPRAYHALMLFLTGAVVATFAAQDLLLFYVSFEAMLIPLYVLVGVWGGRRRNAATLTFVVYTMAGSLLMLASVVAFGVSQGTFSLLDSGTSDNTWIYLGFAVAFAIKAPIFPFHGWLPLAYREAPIEVTAVLSGVVSKTAIYGFLRIGLSKFPDPTDDLSSLVLVLAAAGLIYGSVLAFRSPDLRGIVAYSSMAQMGLITLGVFSLNGGGLSGAILQSVNHALISASMFLLVGMVERRTGTGELASLGGMARGRPVLATIVLIAGMITLAVPGSTTFAGEFLIMAGVYGQGWGYTAAVALAIVLAAMYTLRAISAILHRSPGAAVREEALDLRDAEVALVLPLVACLLFLSAWPAAISDRALDTNQFAAFVDPDSGTVIDTPNVDWLALSPTLCALAASGVALLAAVLVPEWMRRGVSAVAAFAGFVAATVFASVVYSRTPSPEALLADSMTRDRLAAFAQIGLASTGAVAVLVAWARHRRNPGEFYALLAACVAGMLFFVGASNLMTLFLGLEWFSLCLYVLVAYDAERERSLEAGLKYLIVGGFGSAVLLFGSALVYGATGVLGFSEIAGADAGDQTFLVAGLAMIIAGLGFKVSAAPFHMWTPDVYQGAPTAVTAFMSAATKTAALVVTLRVLVTAFPDQSDLWTIAVAVIACISLAWGNFAALAQRDVKRMLAYSSISHTGFMLIAVAADSARGGEALLYYLVPYSAMSLGAFAVVAARERELGSAVSLESLAGLGWERPYHGIALWVFMLGFAGFPLTGGMFGKLFVFSAAYDAGDWWLVLVGVAATAVSLGYYLNVVRWLYMRAAPEGSVVAVGGAPPRDVALDTGIAAAIVVTIGSFFLAQPILDLASDAAASLPF